MARITIIDDDVEFAENTAAALHKVGYVVNVLHATEGAVAALGKDKPDLVILDVMFPDNPVAGFDLARQIRHAKAVKDLPIILLTGVNEEFPMDFSAKDIDPEWMPVHEFIEKPVKIATLLRKVNRLLKSH